MRVWDLERGTARVLDGHTYPVNAVSVTADGRRAVSGGLDQTLRVWDLERGTCLTIFPCEAPVAALAWSAGSNLIAAGLGDGQVHFFRLEE